MANEKRLIDANALRQELQKIIDETQKWRTQKAGKTEAWLYVDEIYKLDNWLGIYAECADLLDDAPTVDAVEVVHGHKVVRERHRGVTRYIPCPCCSSAVPCNKPYTEKVEYCSVCGKKLDDTFQNYCPNCGAKMDGDDHAKEQTSESL